MLQAALPSAEVLAAPQDKHLPSASLPVVAALNVPAAQSEHVLSAVLPVVAALYLPAPQDEHLLSALLPVVAALYLPAPQFVQTVEAAASEYVPTPQSEQSVIAVAPEVPRYLPAKHAWRGQRTKMQQRGQSTVAGQRQPTPSASTQQVVMRSGAWLITVHVEPSPQ